jgi:microcystin-dependent protein
MAVVDNQFGCLRIRCNYVENGAISEHSRGENMSSPFVGEIKLVPYTFAPQGWAFCDGSILAIAENEVLFALIGTTFGGDGQQTFALPDLRGRAAVHQGQTSTIGGTFGRESVTLAVPELPLHGHLMHVSPNVGNQTSPVNHTLARSPLGNLYGTAGDAVMNVSTSAGGNQPHDNRQPFLTCNYIIALFGVFPSQN